MFFNYSSANELSQSVDQALDRINQQLIHILSSPSEGIIERLETCLVNEQVNFNVCQFLQSVSTDEQIREASRQASIKISDFFTDFFSREDVYQWIRKENPHDPQLKRLHQWYLLHFELTGVGHPGAPEILKELNAITTKYQENINNVESVNMKREELEGMPDDYFEGKEVDGGYKVMIGPVDIIPILKYCSKRETRQRMKELYDRRCAKNEELMQTMIDLRNQFARLLGYDNWVQYVTKYQMAKSPQRVESMMNTLAVPLQKRVHQLIEELESFAGHPIESCDRRYYYQQYLQKNYQLDMAKIQSYFPTERVIQKMFDLYQRIFAIKCQRQPLPENVWSSDLTYYEVRDDKSGDIIGWFLCDLQPREGKYDQAFAQTLRSGYRSDNGEQVLPVGVLLGNMRQTLALDEVKTLFHEFGHVLHILCSGYRAKYATLSFESVVIDFVEAPSQILEQWVMEPHILKEISNQELSDEMIKQILKSRELGDEAYEYLRTLTLAMVDQAIYLRNREYKEVWSEVIREYGGYIKEPATFMHSWPHLGDNVYAGSYYSYMWSVVIACDLYSQFKTDATAGYRYRTIILERGNEDPDMLVTEFLGREYNCQAFLQHSLSENTL
jgi:Zn-dependent oligopeptidase